jgi:hypothetical protein
MSVQLILEIEIPKENGSSADQAYGRSNSTSLQWLDADRIPAGPVFSTESDAVLAAATHAVESDVIDSKRIICWHTSHGSERATTTVSGGNSQWLGGWVPATRFALQYRVEGRSSDRQGYIPEATKIWGSNLLDAAVRDANHSLTHAHGSLRGAQFLVL